MRLRARLETAITVDLEARNHLFRIAQEAVQNALKHSRARSIEIDLCSHPDGLSQSINDDGVGLPGAGTRNSGLGMRTLRFRASSIGGRLMIGTRSDGGATVACDLAQPRLESDVAENWFY